MNKAKKKTVERSCAVCHKKLPRKQLMRFVLDKDNLAHIDLGGNSQGRGVYLCHDFSCLDNLLFSKKKPAFKLESESRAVLEGLHAFQKASERPSLDEKRKVEIARLMGLARRAGHCILGKDAVLNALKARDVKLLILARDASENSLKGLRKELAERPVQSLSLFSKQEMAQIFGRAQLAICAVSDQGFADSIVHTLLDVDDAESVLNEQ